MVQEFHVLKCYSCSTYQVHIVKKAKKWECKLCHEKQSIKEVFGKGSGKDCRLHVQKLNALRATREGNNWTDNQFSIFLEAASTSCVIQPDPACTQPTSSNVSNKWDKYLDNNEREESPEEDNRDLLEGGRNQKRKRRKVCDNELDLAGKRKRFCVKDNSWSVPIQRDPGNVKANAWSVPTQKDAGNAWSAATQKAKGSVNLNNEYYQQFHGSISKSNTHSNQYGINNINNSHIEHKNQSQHTTVTTHGRLSSQPGSSKAHQTGFTTSKSTTHQTSFTTSKPTTTTTHLQNAGFNKQSTSVNSKWNKYLTNEEDDYELSEIEENDEETNREIDVEEIHKHRNLYNNKPSETNKSSVETNDNSMNFNEFLEIEENNEVSREIDDNAEDIHKHRNLYNNQPSETNKSSIETNDNSMNFNEFLETEENNEESREIDDNAEEIHKHSNLYDNKPSKTNKSSVETNDNSINFNEFLETEENNEESREIYDNAEEIHKHSNLYDNKPSKTNKSSVETNDNSINFNEFLEIEENNEVSREIDDNTEEIHKHCNLYNNKLSETNNSSVESNDNSMNFNEFVEIEENNEVSREIDDNAKEIHKNRNLYDNKPSKTNKSSVETNDNSINFNEFLEIEENNEVSREINDNAEEINKNRNLYNNQPSETNKSPKLSQTQNTFNNKRKSDEKLEFLQDILNIKHHATTSKMENSCDTRCKMGKSVDDSAGLEDKSIVNQQFKPNKEKNIEHSQSSLFEDLDDTLLDQLLGDF